jgi:hypothetical protein
MLATSLMIGAVRFVRPDVAMWRNLVNQIPPHGYEGEMHGN